MKKLILVAAVLLGAISASQAGVRFNVGIGIPFPAPVVVSPPPVYYAPTPVYQAAPSVVYQAPPPQVVYQAPPPAVVYQAPPPIVVGPPSVYVGFGSGWGGHYRHGYYGWGHRHGWRGCR